METLRIKITEENVKLLINSGKIYIREILGKTEPMGDADFTILSFLEGFEARKADLWDMDFILNQPVKMICITPIQLKADNLDAALNLIQESGYSKGVMIHRLPGEKFTFEASLREAVSV